jgi:DNA-binding PadR family transcriptional regulator
MSTKKFSKSLTGAVSETLILTLLIDKPYYGYELKKKLFEVSGGKIVREAGSMYPLLNKMEKKGWVKSDWDVETADRPRRIYNIQAEGKKELETQKEEWNLMVEILDKLNNVKTRK